MYLSKIAHIPLILIIGGIGVQTITSCSGDEGGNDGASEGKIRTYGIENITDSSFTIVYKWYNCQENGTLEEKIEKETISYSINGKTLSFFGLDFSGNESSLLIGTWTREPFSASCAGYYGYDCVDNDGMSKAVFTQSSFTSTECVGAPGEEREIKNDDNVVIGKWKCIDCGTYVKTVGTQTVTVKYSGTEATATYDGKTCKESSERSKSHVQKACTDAYNKVKLENPGYDGNGDLVDDYYYNILNEDLLDCIKDFPKWSFN